MSDFEKSVRGKIMQLDGITLNEWKKISMILDYYFKRKPMMPKKKLSSTILLR